MYSNFELVDQRIDILTSPDEFKRGLRRVERMGRICYQSAEINPDDNYSEEKTMKFISMLIGKHHESVLEHCSVSAIITTDRAVTHQLVRHRLCSFSQESQRYCNYSLGKFGNKVTYIKPVWFDSWSIDAQKTFLDHLERSTSAYMELLSAGRPEDARAVLPNACKTQIGITLNLRELRHVLKERCSGAAQAQIRQLALAVHSLLPDFLVQDIECSNVDRQNGVIPANNIISFV